MLGASSWCIQEPGRRWEAGARGQGRQHRRHRWGGRSHIHSGRAGACDLTKKVTGSLWLGTGQRAVNLLGTAVHGADGGRAPGTQQRLSQCQG